MKHEILPEHWSIKPNIHVREYLKKLHPSSKCRIIETSYIGITGSQITYSNEPFGQLLTEEQFLYCIGEPVEGEEIEVSNITFSENDARKVILLKLNEDGSAWAIEKKGYFTAKLWQDYRRKPLVFEIDKWAEEKAAFAEGKTIQSRHIFSLEGWEIENSPIWDDDKEYRVKPEPKYVRFTRDDWDLFKMKEVKDKQKSSTIGIINACDNEYVVFSTQMITYQEAFDNIDFADGSPFGKLIEE